MPLISVVIPSYNYARFLPAAVESVLAQTEQAWELLIVDDGSTDNSVAIAEGFCRQDGRIKLFTQKNAGMSAARNVALQKAQGTYIQFLDADDLIHPEKLAIQSAFLVKNTDVDAIVGSWNFFPVAPDKIHQMRPESLAGEALLEALLRDNFIPVSAPLLRKTLMQKVGFYDAAFASYEDWHFWIRCALAGASFVSVPQPVPATSIRKGHPSVMQNKPQMLRNGIKLRRYLHAHLSPAQRFYNAYRLLRLFSHQQMLRAGFTK